MNHIPEASGAPVQRSHLLLLAAILVLALGFRIPDLTRHSLWGDELLSLECSAGNCHRWLTLPRDSVIEHSPRLTRLSGASLTDIWFSLDKDPHPPLYYVALHAWRAGFGSGDGSVRAFSVLAFLAVLVLLFDLGRLLFRPGVALWACALMAVAHPQIWYAQEARSYVLLEAMFLGATAALVRIERFGFRPGRAVALGLCLVGSMLTHYFAAAGCLALGLYAILRLRGSARVSVMTVMAASAAVYLLLWGPFLWRQRQFWGDPGWLADSEPDFHRRWLDRVLMAPMKLFARVMHGDGFASNLAGVLLLSPVLLVRRRPALLLPALCAIAFLALPAATDLGRRTLQLEHERFFLAAGPFVCLLASGALGSHRKRWVRHLFPAGLSLFCLISIPSRLQTLEKDDWRGLARATATNVPRGDLLAIGMRWDYVSGLAYLAIDHYGPEVSPKMVLLTHPADPELQQRLAGSSPVWLVTWAPSSASQLLPGFELVSVEEAGSLGVLVQMHKREPMGVRGSP